MRTRPPAAPEHTGFRLFGLRHKIYLRLRTHVDEASEMLKVGRDGSISIWTGVGLQRQLLHVEDPSPHERVFIGLMTSDRELKASREGSK